MEDAGVPFVAVIGGLRQLDEESAAAAKAAGKSIGAELAKAGFGLVVYFSNEESLEPHVVSGYSAALSAGAGAIRVRYAESQRGQIKFNEETIRPELFDHRLFPGQDWEAPFYRSLVEEEGIDAILLLGGGVSTLIAGQIAVARRLPILAVDQFGGSAAKIWNQLAQASPKKNFYSWGKRPAAAFGLRTGRPGYQEAAVGAGRGDRALSEAQAAAIVAAEHAQAPLRSTPQAIKPYRRFEA